MVITSPPAIFPAEGDTDAIVGLSRSSICPRAKEFPLTHVFPSERVAIGFETVTVAEDVVVKVAEPVPVMYG